MRRRRATARRGLEAGATHYDIESVVLEEVLATCEALTSPQMRGKELTFRRQPCAPGLTVRADREKLQQVVLNLLSNAIKFTNPGGAISLGGDVQREDGALPRLVRGPPANRRDDSWCDALPRS